MKDCEYADTLTREEKFSVFCKVCDNMLESGDFPKQNINNGRRSGRVCQCGKCPYFPPFASHFMYIKRVKGTPLHMRKIESLMNDAIANNKDWKSGNTSVSLQ